MTSEGKVIYRPHTCNPPVPYMGDGYLYPAGTVWQCGKCDATWVSGGLQRIQLRAGHQPAQLAWTLESKRARRKREAK